MISGIFFMTFRIFELIFLIPPLGMLSSIIHGYVSNNELAPAFVLVLFIVVVIATAWVVATMLGYSIAKHNGYFVALVDLLLFGGLIAGVAVLEPVNKTSCSNPDVRNSVYLLSGPFLYQFDNFCNLLKASFGLAIIDIILFFFTTVSPACPYPQIQAQTLTFTSSSHCGYITITRTIVRETSRLDRQKRDDITVLREVDAMAVAVVAVLEMDTTTTEMPDRGQEEDREHLVKQDILQHRTIHNRSTSNG